MKSSLDRQSASYHDAEDEKKLRRPTEEDTPTVSLSSVSTITTTGLSDVNEQPDVHHQYGRVKPVTKIDSNISPSIGNIKIEKDSKKQDQLHASIPQETEEEGLIDLDDWIFEDSNTYDIIEVENVSSLDIQTIDSNNIYSNNRLRDNREADVRATTTKATSQIQNVENYNRLNEQHQLLHYKNQMSSSTPSPRNQFVMNPKNQIYPGGSVTNVMLQQQQYAGGDHKDRRVRPVVEDRHGFHEDIPRVEYVQNTTSNSNSNSNTVNVSGNDNNYQHDDHNWGVNSIHIAAEVVTDSIVSERKDQPATASIEINAPVVQFVPLAPLAYPIPS